MGHLLNTCVTTTNLNKMRLVVAFILAQASLSVSWEEILSFVIAHAGVCFPQSPRSMEIPTGAILSTACSTPNNWRSLSLWISVGFRRREKGQGQGQDPTR